MSNLWITAKQASWEDASQESNQYRMDRAHRWVDQQGDKTDPKGLHIPIPENFGDYHNGMDWPSEIDPPYDHWHHLPTQPINLRQKIIHHQWGVRPETVHKKIDEDHPDYDDTDYGFHGDTEEKDTDAKEPLFIKHEGETHLVDGHHRFVRDRLLGKDTTQGKIYDADDPSKHYEKCRQCKLSGGYW